MQQIESLYIHWPFCTSKCYYCDFVALEQHSDFQDAYHETLLQEIRAYGASLTGQNFESPEHRSNTSRQASGLPQYERELANEINPPTAHPEEDRKSVLKGMSGTKPKIKTIFIGGGTPSLYPLEKLDELFKLLHQTFDLTQTTEITLEANPADVTEDRADGWESAGINRISCGVQVLDDAVLTRLNRRQRSTDVVNAAKILPKYFSNISMDLIIGMPGVTDATWLKTIETLCAWPIQHLSIYFLTVHEKTPLYFKVQRGDLVLPDEDALLNLYEATVAYVGKHGFEQYEISNFAKSGFASQHNIGYWQRRPYKGFGIGAASFDGLQRTVNDKNLTRYLDNGKIGLFEPLEIETLTLQQVTLERLMLSLRQASGMPLTDMVYCVGEKKKESLIASLQELESSGLLHIENDFVKLTLRGMILENEVVLRLI